MNTQNPYTQEKIDREQQKVTAERSGKIKKVGKQLAVWGSTVVALGLAVWGIVILVQNYEPPKAPDGSITIDNPITAEDWVKGNRDAKVVLTEYSDFQCPACKSYVPIVKELENVFGKEIAIVYRHFPLDIHSNAKPMARAAEAAGLQGKFFEMHDLIFENQSAWSNQRNVKDTVMSYAQTLKLDMAKFESDFESSSTKNKVDTSLDDAVRIGFSYTPSFLLNGTLIENPRTYADFYNLIAEAIAATKASATPTE